MEQKTSILRVKPISKLFSSVSFSVPHFHMNTLKTEVGRLEKIGVIKKYPEGRCSCQSFIIPKEDGTVRFVSDFRKLNKIIDIEPFPTPMIDELLESLAGFQWFSRPLYIPIWEGNDARGKKG